MNDVSRIYQRMQHYDLTEIVDWLDTLGREYSAFSGRMASMCESAIDELGFRRICDSLKAGGFTLQTGRTIQEPNRIAPLGWAVVAVRDGG